MLVILGNRSLVRHLVQNHCIKLARRNAEAVDKDREGGEVCDGGDEGLHQAKGGVPLDGQAFEAGEKIGSIFHPGCRGKEVPV